MPHGAQQLLHSLSLILIDLAAKGIKSEFHVKSTKIKVVRL